MGCTAQHLLDVCWQAYTERWDYIYGAWGQGDMSSGAIRSLQDQYGRDCVWDEDVDLGGNGRNKCDCSGVISCATGDRKNSTTYHDEGGQDISPWDCTTPGWLLWFQGHIGVYIGDGMYMAMDGSSRDAYVGELSENGWVAAFPCADVDYSIPAVWPGFGDAPAPQEPVKQVDRSDGFTASGVEYEVATSDGWLGTVTTCSDDVEHGYAGWQDKGIKAVRARRVDGRTLTLKVEMTDGAVYDETIFDGSLWGSNPSGDGYAGDLDGDAYIAKLWAGGCNGRGAVAGKPWFPPVNGDDYIGEEGEALVALQLWA